MNDFKPVLRHHVRENRSKAAANFFSSPLFYIPANNTLKITSRVVGSRLTGKHMSKKDILALVPEVAVSIGTDLAMHAINKASSKANSKNSE